MRNPPRDVVAVVLVPTGKNRHDVRCMRSLSAEYEPAWRTAAGLRMVTFHSHVERHDTRKLAFGSKLPLFARQRTVLLPGTSFHGRPTNAVAAGSTTPVRESRVMLALAAMLPTPMNGSRVVSLVMMGLSTGPVIVNTGHASMS